MECERRFTWLPWPKSPIYHRTTVNPAIRLRSPPSSPPHSPIQKHSFSFKDVEALLNPPLVRPYLSHSPSSSTTSSLKDLQALLNNPKPSIFHRLRSWAQTRTRTQTQTRTEQPPDSKNRVVVYYTSLRVVRKTFNDCRAVRSILKGYRVKLDERDLSMDSTFVEELQEIIGKKKEEEMASLPMVFVHGKHVGGADEIRRLHDSGELRRQMRGLPPAEAEVCRVCGGYRFLVCKLCDGSHRVYEDEKSGFKACSSCNQNGMIKCSSCTSVLF